VEGDKFSNADVAFEPSRVYWCRQHLNGHTMPLTPADLVAIVAADLGLPVTTVKNYDRKLMEAGLRTKKGHGRGSALMGPKDAAVLLAAIASSDEIAQAPECVRRLYGLTCFGPAGRPVSKDSEAVYADLPFLRGISTFGKALVAVMQYSGSAPLTRQASGMDEPDYSFGFEVHIAGGLPYHADLLVWGSGQDRHVHFSNREGVIPGHLRVTRRIVDTQKIAEAVSGRKRDEWGQVVNPAAVQIDPDSPAKSKKRAT
jgi:hypothetical protein